MDGGGGYLILTNEVPEQLWALLLKSHCLEENNNIAFIHTHAKSLLFN